MCVSGSDQVYFLIYFFRPTIRMFTSAIPSRFFNRQHIVYDFPYRVPLSPCLSTKKKVYSLLHPEIGDTKLDKVINAFLIFLIASNIVAVILETVPRIYHGRETFFHYFDLVSVIIFSIEYVLRVWSANLEGRYKHRIHGRLKYMLSWPALIDLLAILPVYVHVFVG